MSLTHRPDSHQRLVWLTVLAVVALLVRLTSVRQAASAGVYLTTESQHYLQWARHIVAGHGRSLLPFEQSPGYAYFLAALLRFVHPHPVTGLVANAVLGTSTILALACWHRRRESWSFVATGLLGAFFSPWLRLTGELLPETLQIALLAWAGLLAARPQRLTTWRLWALGLLLAASCLVRATSLVVVPFYVLLLRVSHGRRGVAWVVVPSLIALAAVGVLGWRASGQWAFLPSSGGLNLWLGNHSLADGVSPFARGEAEAIVPSIFASSPNVIVADRALFALALESPPHAPLDWLGLLGRKLMLTLSAVELPNTVDISWQDSQVRLLRSPFTVGFRGALVLSLASLPWLDRAVAKRMVGLLAASFVGLATCVLFFTCGRFRALVPLALIPASSLGMWGLVQASVPRARWLALVLACLGLLVSSGNWHQEDGFFVPQLAINAAAAELRAGQNEAAVIRLRTALAQRPNDADGWQMLAYGLSQLSRLDEAQLACREGFRRFPRHEALARCGAPPPP